MFLCVTHSPLNYFLLVFAPPHTKSWQLHSVRWIKCHRFTHPLTVFLYMFVFSCWWQFLIRHSWPVHGGCRNRSRRSYWSHNECSRYTQLSSISPITVRSSLVCSVLIVQCLSVEHRWRLCWSALSCSPLLAAKNGTFSLNVKDAVTLNNVSNYRANGLLSDQTSVQEYVFCVIFRF